ncbi:hypothetical protein R3P38DRAFT_3297231, partial [Favolaschia claudopus]
MLRPLTTPLVSPHRDLPPSRHRRAPPPPSFSPTHSAVTRTLTATTPPPLRQWSLPSRLNRSQSTPSYRARSLCSAQDSKRSKGWRRMTRDEVVGQAMILFDDDRAFDDLSNSCISEPRKLFQYG